MKNCSSGSKGLGEGENAGADESLNVNAQHERKPAPRRHDHLPRVRESYHPTTRLACTHGGTIRVVPLWPPFSGAAWGLPSP